MTTVFETVGLDDEQQLLAAVRQYQRLRTYPEARDASQRALHAHLVGLESKGLVRRHAQDGNSVIWTT